MASSQERSAHSPRDYTHNALPQQTNLTPGPQRGIMMRTAVNCISFNQRKSCLRRPCARTQCSASKGERMEAAADGGTGHFAGHSTPPLSWNSRGFEITSDRDIVNQTTAIITYITTFAHFCRSANVQLLPGTKSRFLFPCRHGIGEQGWRGGVDITAFALLFEGGVFVLSLSVCCGPDLVDTSPFVSSWQSPLV